MNNFIESQFFEEPNYSFKHISVYVFKEVSKYSRIMITGDGVDELIGVVNFLDKYYKYFLSLPN